MMGMCVQKVVKSSLFLALLVFIAVFCGCEAMDDILPSTGIYKINALVNDSPLDECSFVAASDEMRPFFEEPVSNDPDITALVVFLKDSNGDIKGWKVVYSLEHEVEKKPVVASSQEGENSPDDAKEDKTKTPKYVNGEEKIIPVENLDNDLPFLPLPDDLPMGQYAIVYQIMSGKNILQRTEKSIFYLGRTGFSYEAINVYLPGIAESSQLIPQGTVIMLEAKLDFDSYLDPYIVWYDGKRKISEGYFSDGKWHLFWEAPEQSGFFSLSAEIFPVKDHEGLVGYIKEISLLVSSKPIDMNLISENIEQLLHWYVFEGNLNDSKMTASAARSLKPAAKNVPKWMGINETYGISTGRDNIFMLPKVSILGSEPKTWQILFRFKAVNYGEIFSVQFDSSSGISMHLYIEDENFVLTLVSPLTSISQTINLPKDYIESGRESFFTTGVKFSITPRFLSAQLNIMGESINNTITAKPVSLEAGIEKEFQILLGFARANDTPGEQSKIPQEPEFTALWDEFALYNMPPMDILAADIKPSISEDQPEAAAVSVN